MTCRHANHTEESFVLPRSETSSRSLFSQRAPGSSTEPVPPPVSTSTDQSEESARSATNSGWVSRLVIITITESVGATSRSPPAPVPAPATATSTAPPRTACQSAVRQLSASDLRGQPTRRYVPQGQLSRVEPRHTGSTWSTASTRVTRPSAIGLRFRRAHHVPPVAAPGCVRLSASTEALHLGRQPGQFLEERWKGSSRTR